MTLYFNIGVNIIGLPEIHKHDVKLFKVAYYRNFHS